MRVCAINKIQGGGAARAFHAPPNGAARTPAVQTYPLSTAQCASDGSVFVVDTALMSGASCAKIHADAAVITPTQRNVA